MRLGDVAETFARLEFPSADEQAHPDLDAVLAARTALQSAVVDDDFLADCIGRELQLIAANEFRGGLIPFLRIAESGVRFAFGYWPPGGTPGPHEHTAWTITAVCRNHLEVHTYDREESYRRRELVAKNRFTAPAGLVGYIYDPCIHAPINTSDDWSLSLHVVSPRDRDAIEANDPPPGITRRTKRPVGPRGPYASVLATRFRLAGVHLLARVVAGMDVADATALLEKCAALGSPSTRRLCAERSGGRADLVAGGYRLRRTHPDLMLRLQSAGNRATLLSDLPDRTIEELTVNALAADAIAFAAREAAFDVRDLPGKLTDAERTVIGETLEDTGLFRRAA